VELDKVIKAARKFAKPYRVTGKDGFRLKDIDPRGTGDLQQEDKPRAKEALQTGIEALAELQDMLYAQDRWGVLLVFQAMDAAGKDGAIKHVMSGINPQGCHVTSFKAPSAEELDHDYLWRCSRNLPERRFLERIDNPEKNWKFSAADARERTHWKGYMAAYENAIRETLASVRKALMAEDR